MADQENLPLEMTVTFIRTSQKKGFNIIVNNL